MSAPYGKLAAFVLLLSVASVPARADTVTYGYTGGVQYFTAPFAGQYDIIALGAKGGDAHTIAPFASPTISGGAGVFVEGIVDLNVGEQLQIYVGGEGGNGAYHARSPAYAYGAGGGGATFVGLNGAYIEIAGGGGGAGTGTEGFAQDGVAVPDAYVGSIVFGGQYGNGGGHGIEVQNPNPDPALVTYSGGGGGGTGILTSGQDGGLGGGQGGQGLVGGLGGGGGLAGSGGYGGGGGGDIFGDGGGGGGYSGGGGGSDIPTHLVPENDPFPAHIEYGGYGGGGGGSYFNGDKLVTIIEGLGQGNGYFQVTYTPPAGGGTMTGPPHIPSIPEPSTWATLILGLSLAGAVMRDRRARPGVQPLAIPLGR